MPKFDVKQDFDGAIRGCYVKHFKADTTVEIDDLDLVAVAIKENWIEPHVEAEAFPEDYMQFTVLQEIQVPGPDGELAGDILEVGAQIGMSAAVAQDWVEAGLIAPAETDDGSDPTKEPKEVKVDDPKVDPEKVVGAISKPLTDEEKAAIKAPANKAAKAAPKAKDAATE